MILLTLRRLFNKKWMFCCLLIGFIIVGSVACSIPMFSDGILRRLMVRELQEYQASYNVYPGTYQISINYSVTAIANGASYSVFNDFTNDAVSAVDIPILTQTNEFTLGKRAFVLAPYNANSAVSYSLNITAMDGFNEKVEVVQGRLANPGIIDGAYEVVMNEQTMAALRLGIGREYIFTSPLIPDLASAFSSGQDCYRIRVVGLVRELDINDPYWYMNLSTYRSNVFICFEDAVRDFGDTIHITDSVRNVCFDYTKIKIDSIPSIIATLTEHENVMTEIGGTLRFYMPTRALLESYQERQSEMQTMLLVLVIPVVVLLCFYIFMVSQLKIEAEANEIAVLKSRGASNRQIFGGYLLEWGILALISMILCPLIGYLLCFFLGSANGFLDFVSRTALVISINEKVFFYLIVTMVVFALAMLLPAVKASRTTIVEHKQQSSRLLKTPLWQKFGLDILLIAASLYGLMSYTRSETSLSHLDSSMVASGVDPLIFAMTTFFLLGIGLLFLRLYPYFVKLLFFLGKKRWSPAFYASFVRMSRVRSKETFVMLFIIFSISVGVFSANAARTINANITRRIEYAACADISMSVRRDYLKDGTDIDLDFLKENYDIDAALLYHGKAGSNGLYMRSTKMSQYDLDIMGINTFDFGSTVNMPSNLLPAHINHYLNLLGSVQNGVLLSTNFRESVALGDSINLIVTSDSTSFAVTVVGFFDYWPGYSSETESPVPLAVFNYSFLQYFYADALENFDECLWMKRPDGLSVEDISDILNTPDGVFTLDPAKIENVVNPTPISLGIVPKPGAERSFGTLNDITFVSQELVKAKNDPIIQGLNGMLSLSFLVIMTITTVGFLIYWILSLKGRTLQFGIFRALGMSYKSVYGMLGIEQCLVSIVSILFALLLGDVTSLAFIQLFSMLTAAQGTTLPFLVFHSAVDYLKIYFVILVMLAVGAFVLLKIISSIKIDQALKLGED